MSKWYSKQINIVNLNTLFSVLSYGTSAVFYFIEKISDNGTAKFISIYSFWLGIGENIGDRIAGRYPNKKVSLYLDLFLIAVLIGFLIFGKFFKNSELILSVLTGIGFGARIGFGLRKLRVKKMIN